MSASGDEAVDSQNQLIKKKKSKKKTKKSQSPLEDPESPSEKPKPSSKKPKPPSEKPKPPSEKPKPPSEKPKPPSEKPKPPSEKPKPPSEKPKPPSEKPKPPSEKPKPPSDKPKPPSDKIKLSTEKPKPQTDKPKSPKIKLKAPSSDSKDQKDTSKEKSKKKKKSDKHDTKSTKKVQFLSDNEKEKVKDQKEEGLLAQDDIKSPKKVQILSDNEKENDQKEEGLLEQDDEKSPIKVQNSSNNEKEKDQIELSRSNVNQLSSSNSLTFKLELYKNIDDFEKIGLIGRGSFGSVNKYKEKGTDKLFAFKEISLSEEDTENSKRELLEIRREIVLTSLFKHPTLHSLYGIIDNTQEGSFIIITPFYEQGDLEKLINKEAKKTAPPEWDITQKFIVMYGIASGMYILHQQAIIHRDLKPANVLLTDNLEPLITDFGLSKIVDQGNAMLQTAAVGSPIYTAPEVLEQAGVDDVSYDGKKSDVFSFAILCFQLFTNILMPYKVKNVSMLSMQVSKGIRPNFPSDFNPELKELIENCWKQSPEDRYSFDQVLETIGKQEFIDSINDVDQDRFNEYKVKVAPDRKFLFDEEVEDFEEEYEEEEEEEEEASEVIPKFDSENFTIDKSLLKKMSDYDKLELIGKGQYGYVFKYKEKESGDIVAIKKVDVDPNNKKNLQREVFILSNYHHPTLLRTYGFIDKTVENEFYMITPFCKNGDLEGMISKENKRATPPEWNHTQKFIVLYGIAAGMYYLHNHDLIHRDLKPGNVLLNDDLEPVISDFGLSKIIDQGNTLYQTNAIGTPAFMAPEIFNCEECENGVVFDGKKSDVYAYGMICYQLLTGLTPFDNIKTQTQLVRALMKQQRPPFESDFNESYKSLIENCWQEEPEKRPTFEEILTNLSNLEFIQAIGRINLEKLEPYQNKVVPQKFRTVSKENSKKQKVHKDEKKPTDIRRDTWRKSPHEIVKELADAGEPNSQNNYGCMLRDGKGIPINLEEAASYFKKSADQGHVEGIINYAKCLKEGSGVEKDEKEAYRLMEIAATQDNSEAQYNLGIWYAYDQPPQYNNAAIWLKKAADDINPDPEAPAAYALLLERGKLGPIPAPKIITDYYQKSSEHGSPKGMYHMALLYHSGEDANLSRNINEAIRLYNLSASNGIQDAILSLTYACEEVKKYDEAFNHAKFYADQDNFYGYLRLHELYESGLGCTKDEEKSKEYLEKACDKKFSKVQSHASSLFARGKGVPVDPAKAFFWAKISAENGSPDGATTLGDYYSDGFGVEKKDLNKALEWAHKGAEGGDTGALRLLSKIYGSLKDKENKLKYLQEAAKSGDERSMIKLGEYYVSKYKYNDALIWFKEAAEKMNPTGCFYYGEELLTGNHTDKDVNEGLRYLELSASLNNEKAIEMLQKIYSEGTPDVPKNEQKELEYSHKLIQCKNAGKKKNRRKSVV